MRDVEPPAARAGLLALLIEIDPTQETIDAALTAVTRIDPEKDEPYEDADEPWHLLSGPAMSRIGAAIALSLGVDGFEAQAARPLFRRALGEFDLDDIRHEAAIHLCVNGRPDDAKRLLVGDGGVAAQERYATVVHLAARRLVASGRDAEARAVLAGIAELPFERFTKATMLWWSMLTTMTLAGDRQGYVALAERMAASDWANAAPTGETGARLWTYLRCRVAVAMLISDRQEEADQRLESLEARPRMRHQVWYESLMHFARRGDTRRVRRVAGNLSDEGRVAALLDALLYGAAPGGQVETAEVLAGQVKAAIDNGDAPDETPRPTFPYVALAHAHKGDWGAAYTAIVRAKLAGDSARRHVDWAPRVRTAMARLYQLSLRQNRFDFADRVSELFASPALVDKVSDRVLAAFADARVLLAKRLAERVEMARAEAVMADLAARDLLGFAKGHEVGLRIDFPDFIADSRQTAELYLRVWRAHAEAMSRR